ncbi:MAG: molybdopterin-guanine dinucleotide biosynthesis protein B [Candidatus Bipolaricaulota bacterium]
MSQPPVVSVYGNSDSGKTELVVDLIQEFKGDGLKVCTIKHSPSEVSLDEKGKDTWRHREGGAELVAFSTEVETDFLFPKELAIGDILEMVDRMVDPDLVIAEGYKDEDVPKIAVGEIDERENTLDRFDGNRARLKEAIRREIEVKAIEEELPGLDCGRCGYASCRELAEAIHAGDNALEDCEVREGRSVMLEVDGEEIPLENFPALMLEEGLKGMLRSLKGVDGEIERIDLTIDG